MIEAKCLLISVFILSFRTNCGYVSFRDFRTNFTLYIVTLCSVLQSKKKCTYHIKQ